MSFYERFIRFAGVGVIGTSVHYLLLIALVQLVAAEAVIASSAGALAGAFTNYILNYHFTFQSEKSHREAMAKFFVVATIAFIANAGFMYLFTHIIHVYYLAAQIVTTTVVLVITFLGNHFWSFKKQVSCE